MFFQYPIEVSLSKRLKLGIIGGGVNSAVGSAHVSSLRLDANWDFEAGFFSRDTVTNRESGSVWDVHRIYSDLVNFIETERDNLDAVLVLTPTPNHYETIERLLVAGFNVISEKALSVSSCEAESLLKIADEKHRKLLVTFNYTGYPMVREIQSRVKSNRYGKIHTFNIEMPQEGFVLKDLNEKNIAVQEWRKRDQKIPTVSLDLGVHVLNMAGFLLGAGMRSVSALHNHSGDVTNVIDKVFAIGDYENGVNFTALYGKVFPGFKNGLKFRLFGEFGGCEWVQMQPDSFVEFDIHGKREIVNQGSFDLLEAHKPRYSRFKAGHPTGFIEAFANLYHDIYEELRSGLSGTDLSHGYVFTAANALTGLKELEFLHESARTKTWMTI